MITSASYEVWMKPFQVGSTGGAEPDVEDGNDDEGGYGGPVGEGFTIPGRHSELSSLLVTSRSDLVEGKTIRAAPQQVVEWLTLMVGKSQIFWCLRSLQY
jgi:hypothetical protein